MAHLDAQLTRPKIRRRWRKRALEAPWWLYTSAFLVVLIMVLPLGYLLIRASSAGEQALRELMRPGTWRVLAGSASLAFVVAFCSVIIGVPLAWLTTRTDLPGRRIWLVLAMLPLAIPSYIGAWAMIAVAGPRGLLQQWLAPLGIERLPSIYGFGGAAFALTLFGYPYILLSVRTALRRMDPAIEEASRSLGQSNRRTFWRITLPQLRPAVAAGSLLVTLYTLSDFGAVSLLRYDSFTRVIYQRYRTSFDRTGAAVLALILIGMALLLLMAEHSTRGRGRYYRSSSGVQRRAILIPLRKWKIPALVFCSLITLVGVILPIVAIVSWLVIGLKAGQPLNFQWEDIRNSLVAASLAAVVTTVAALPLVVLAVRYPSRITTFLERSSYIGYGLPGIVVALALVFWGARYVPWLYQSLGMLVLAYMVRFLPQSIGSIRTTMLQISPRLEEAAQALGRKRLNIVRTIVLPMLMPGVFSGAALVFLSTLKELPATLLLGPNSFDTLATDIWQNANEVQFSQTALPALILMGAAAASLALLLIQDRKL